MSTLTTHIPRTLIADDQPDVLAALRLLLKGAGYQTEAASSPKAVLDAIKKRNFDVVLIDLNYARDTTSGKEGLDLISRIQAEDNSLPIVVMTAWGTVDLAVEAMRRGVRDFVQKPWENSRLLQVLRTQIDQGRTRRRLRYDASQLRARSRELDFELREAREIQASLMPAKAIQLEGFDVSCAWRAARAIGGDYLAAFPLKSAASKDFMPDSLCTRLNQLMCGNIPINKFISCFYGLLDTRRRVLRFTNAGHNPPLLMRSSGQVARLEPGGRVLGAFTGSTYEQREIQLNSGDRLVLFTDGVTEVRSASGEEFGEKRLRELLAREHRRSAAQLESTIMNKVSKFCGDQFDDDAALMVVEVK